MVLGLGMAFDAPGSEKNLLLWCAVIPIFTYPIWGIIALRIKNYKFSYMPFVIAFIAGGLNGISS